MPAYRPFVIHIAQPVDGAYPVTAEFQGLVAHESIPVVALQSHIPRAPAGGPPGAVLEYERSTGGQLFHALFRGEILALLNEARQWLAPGERLRIVLGQPIPAPLASLPWELIFEAQGDPAALNGTRAVPLVRHAPAPVLPHPPPQKGALRVLVVVGFFAESGAAVAAEREQALVQLERGLSVRDTLGLVRGHLREPASMPDLARRFTRGRRYHITLLRHATRESVREMLRAAHEAGEDFHAVHFLGQGRGQEGGALLLELTDGQPDAVPPADFAALVVGPGVNLLAVNLCQCDPIRDLMPAVAAEAVRCGASVVLGLISPALDLSTAAFALEFYHAFAGGEPLEIALAHARRAVRLLASGPAQSDYPALYVGHTADLVLSSLDRVHVLPLGLRLFNWLLATMLAVVGTTGSLLDLPSFPATVRTRVPIVRCLYPWPMDQNRLTIAFAPFTVVHEDGSLAGGSAGRALADFLYDRFVLQFDELQVGIPYEMRAPSAVCAVPGRNADERARQAAALADKINADILIYGVITDTLKADRLALEFNVSYRGFENMQELAGPYALGGSIPVQLPFEPESLLVIENPPHLVRMKILSQLVVGLSYLSADNPEKAVSYFRLAEGNQYWPSIDGKEFAYLLLGHGLMRQASLNDQPELLQAAYDAYSSALVINPAYTRARLGQASTLAMMALPRPGQPLDRARLNQADAAYEVVVTDAMRQDEPQIAATARAGLGYVCYVRNLADQTPRFDACRKDLEAVISQHEAGDERIANQAGLAHGYLAGIARAEGDMAQALAQYEMAAQLVVPASRARYLASIGALQCQLRKLEPALAAYDQAIDEARLYGRAGDVERYASEMEQLRQKGCD